MATVLSIDPGLANRLGWAFFYDGVLTGCGTRATIGSIYHKIDRSTVIVVEEPQVYPVSKGDPNDLIKIALDAGILIGSIAPGCLVLPFKPHMWKGSVPKDIHQRRILKVAGDIQSMLSLLRSSDRSHAIDAIGLGLYHLGRLPR